MKDEQVSIFDVLPNEDMPDFKTIPEDKVIECISNTTGLVFKLFHWPGSTGVYRAEKGDGGVDIHFGHYVMKEREGEPYIGCSVWRKRGNEGRSIPCGSIEEAIDVIRRNLY